MINYLKNIKKNVLTYLINYNIWYPSEIYHIRQKNNTTSIVIFTNDIEIEYYFKDDDIYNTKSNKKLNNPILKNLIVYDKRLRDKLSGNDSNASNDLNDMLSSVERFEVIDTNGRVMCHYGKNINFSIQDNQKTLKIFID